MILLYLQIRVENQQITVYGRLFMHDFLRFKDGSFFLPLLFVTSFLNSYSYECRTLCAAHIVDVKAFHFFVLYGDHTYHV